MKVNTAATSFVLNEKYFPTKTTASKPLLLLCGFGGRIWQAKRLIYTLNKAGYDVTALDFSKDVLSKGNPDYLIALVNEVVERAESYARKASQPIQLVGISLGALLCLNILRQSASFQSAVLITGGDIAKIAQKIYPKIWTKNYDELATMWQGINMYSDPKLLSGKRILFVLHDSSKLIDIRDVRQEITKQNAAGNTLIHTSHSKFDHVATIIEETVLFPQRTLKYIEQVEAP